MIKKILRRLFGLKTRYISPVDMMLDKRHRQSPASESQQTEIDKHAKISQLRDQSSKAASSPD